MNAFPKRTWFEPIAGLHDPVFHKLFIVAPHGGQQLFAWHHTASELSVAFTITMTLIALISYTDDVDFDPKDDD